MKKQFFLIYITSLLIAFPLKGAEKIPSPMKLEQAQPNWKAKKIALATIGLLAMITAGLIASDRNSGKHAHH